MSARRSSAARSAEFKTRRTAVPVAAGAGRARADVPSAR
jgi:hypothetical protein